MIEHYIAQGSTYAADIDGLVLLVGLLVGFWFVLIEVIFFGLILAFRKREGVRAQYVSGEEKHEKRWIAVPHELVLLCDVVIIIAAVRVWVDVKQTLPPAQETVRVIAQQWAWSFVHAGPDGLLDTPDDIKTVDELHVKIGTTYHYKLEARDVLHSFSVPVFRLKQDAIPGRVITGWFKATRLGIHDIQCAEICGIGHALMPARIYIQSQADYATWMTAHAAPSTATASAQ